MPLKSRREESSEATRSALIESARKLFDEHGYGNTSIEQVVQRARVTRGALYHHFTNKRALFLAAYEQIHIDIMERSRAAIADVADPWQRALRAIDSHLDSCLDPMIQRNMMHEAASVLGWDAWRDVASRHGLTMVELLLEELVEAGIMRQHRVDLSAPIILAAVVEAGMMVSDSKEPETDRRDVEPILKSLLFGLRADSQ